MQTSLEILLRVGGLAMLAGVVTGCAIVTPPDDGDGDGDSDADLDWIPPIDSDALACRDSVCGLWPQCGCPPGQHCVHTDEGDRHCINAGPLSHGDECIEEEEECGVGLVCAGLADEPTHCVQYCSDDADCAAYGEGSLCELLFVDEMDREIARACSSSCDPASITPDCADDVHCVIFVRESTGELFTHCAGEAGTGQAGSPCNILRGAADCMPGFFCAGDGDGDHCIRRCTMPDGAECGGVEICRSFPLPAIVGSLEYGYCL